MGGGLIVLTLMAALAAAPVTWTLYERAGSLSFAHETPDSDVLDAVLECKTASGGVSVSFYGADRPTAGAGSAKVSAGAASAVVTLEGGSGLSPHTRLMLRTDHPVFQAFAGSGALSVEAGGKVKTVSIDAERRADFAKFVKGCG
jgi:hypothetical protein